MPVEIGAFASTIIREKYEMTPGEGWEGIAARVVDSVMRPLLPDLADETTRAVVERKFLPGGRYLYASGRPYHQTQNCLLLTVDDNRESIGDLYRRAAVALMTGAGIGVVWSRLRPRGKYVSGMGGTSTGPTSFMQGLNEIGRQIMQGGSRRSAIWAGLHWTHEDVFEFMSLKDWPESIASAKRDDFNAFAPMDMTNISVILDDEFFAAYEDDDHPQSSHARRVYWTAVEKMLTTGEPGFSVDVGENAGEHLRNACTEVTSSDDNDICNLGSLNLARIDSVEEMERITELGTAFLLCGTVYSKVPYEEVGLVREKNRRLGLGLMGIYDWLTLRGRPYAPDHELSRYMEAYRDVSDRAAKHYADRLGVSHPLGKRAIAPNGTIGIVAEVAGTGIEPLFAVAMKRRYLKDGLDWHFQYVVDAAAQRLIDDGADPESMETAYSLAQDPERRLVMQAWLQQYVDHAISSTLNLPAHDQQAFTIEEFGSMLYEHLPSIRGVTAYPDGARGGQPLNVVPYQEARDFAGYEYQEVGNEIVCKGNVCGI